MSCLCRKKVTKNSTGLDIFINNELFGIFKETNSLIFKKELMQKRCLSRI